MNSLGHAPRERVSWNDICLCDKGIDLVTLHVSVWVEIFVSVTRLFLSMSRSTWACELKYEEVLTMTNNDGHAPRERVSWNNKSFYQLVKRNSHAPRERVSWNSD